MPNTFLICGPSDLPKIYNKQQKDVNNTNTKINFKSFGNLFLFKYKFIKTNEEKIKIIKFFVARDAFNSSEKGLGKIMP